jgi:hypothetical protein
MRENAMTRIKTWFAIAGLLAAAVLGGQTPTQPRSQTIQVIVTPDPSAAVAPKSPTPQVPQSQAAVTTKTAPQSGPGTTIALPKEPDIFVMPREASLHERASDKTGVVTVVAGGERLREIGPPMGRFLRVTRILDAEAGTEAASGFIARDAVSVFPPGPRGTAELAAAGSALAGTAAYRTVGVAMLERASERLREEGAPDAALEIRLGESAETLARNNGRWPAGVPRTFRACRATTKGAAGTAGAGRCVAYSGDAFTRALALANAPGAQGLEGIRDRATAGLLRAKYPETADTLPLLWQETADWLALAETARDREALEAATERLGASGLALGRDLLAISRLDQLDALRLRLISTAQRATSAAPGSGCGPRLLGRAVLLQAMRGDGSRAFPQEARARAAGFERVVRVEGALGALTLATRREGQGAPSPWTSIPATPVLPVPGSLRLSRDGRFAAWIEVVGPSRLLPVIARLDPPEPAREIAFLSSGRPLRDRTRENVLARLDDFSDDGSRLGLSVLAWDDTPGPVARRFVVSSQDARIVSETDSARKQRRAVEGKPAVGRQ